MKQRVLSALVGLVILAVVFVFLDTLLFNGIMAAVAVVGMLELLKAVGCTKFRGMTALAVVMALVLQFALVGYVRQFLPLILFLLILSFFGLLMKNHATMRVEQAAMTFFFSLFVPLFFGAGVYIRDHSPQGAGMFYLLWALGSAWLCDTGAYFTGTFLGKHKLAPHISPKKTVEGVIGGLITATGCMVLIALAYQALIPYWYGPVSIDLPLVALLTPVFAAVGVLGDLSASVVKRQFDVKDYGNVMPGHGGVMDRFDSVLFTLPAVYMATQYFPAAFPL